MPLHFKPIVWTRDELTSAVRGKWIAGSDVNWRATGVTRRFARIQVGDLYTPTPEESKKAPQRIERIFAQGAAAVVLDGQPEALPAWAPVLLVDNVLQSHLRLAEAARSRTSARIVAVTGSVGKTSVKEAVATVLSHQGSVVTNYSSENDIYAICEAVAQVPPNGDYAVIEIGMLGSSSVNYKSKAAGPNVAVITSIGTAHGGYHESLDSIAKTKADIFDGLEPGGTVVLPRDSAYYDYLLDRARATEMVQRVVSFGESKEADFRLVECSLQSTHSDVVVAAGDRNIAYRVGLAGKHHVINSLVILATADAVGADVERAADSLATLTPAFRRGERFRVHADAGVCEIIDDTWNANPESVRAAIERLTLAPVPKSGRRVLFLGDMLELGENSDTYHQNLAEPILDSGIDLVCTVGPSMKLLHDRLPSQIRGDHCEDSKEMVVRAPRLLNAGDVALVKGSNHVEMSRVVTSLLGGKPRDDCRAPREWNLLKEANEAAPSAAVPAPVAASPFSHGDLESPVDACVSFDVHAAAPGAPAVARSAPVIADPLQPRNDSLPTPVGNTDGVLAPTIGPVILAPDDVEFFARFRQHLLERRPIVSGITDTQSLFERTQLPKDFWGFALTVYQPGKQRLMVVRAANAPAFENIRRTLERALTHPRIDEFHLQDRDRCRLQLDFIVDEPEPIDLSALSESALDANRFEVGIDGLRIVGEATRRYLLPGDAFVRSILSPNQLRRYISRLFPGTAIDELDYYRFRWASYVSSNDGWLRLYRGLPAVRPATKEALYRAAVAGVDWIIRNQQPDGRFLYYYDAAADSRRDREHPKRDPETDPYYNLLRHGGGVITVLLHRALRQAGMMQSADAGEGGGEIEIDETLVRQSVESAIEFFLKQLVTYDTPTGTEAAYAYFNKKAKLGGSGIGLYMLALYQRLFRSARYAEHARLLANHLVNEILDSGGFKYYHVYLDRKVTETENRAFFSFYYPGEAVIGLANYCQHVCESEAERDAIYGRVHEALRFLFVERPQIYREHYTSLPADSWLMMAISDLWDAPQFRRESYSRPVFQDADQMVDHMYTPRRAPYPDYAGSRSLLLPKVPAILRGR